MSTDSQRQNQRRRENALVDICVFAWFVFTIALAKAMSALLMEGTLSWERILEPGWFFTVSAWAIFTLVTAVAAKRLKSALVALKRHQNIKNRDTKSL